MAMATACMSCGSEVYVCRGGYAVWVLCLSCGWLYVWVLRVDSGWIQASGDSLASMTRYAIAAARGCVVLCSQLRFSTAGLTITSY